jgi:hypothetical protein
MTPVKTTAAVLVASMSMFSAIPASAAGERLRIDHARSMPAPNNGNGGSTSGTGTGSGTPSGSPSGTPSGAPSGSGSGAGSVGGSGNGANTPNPNNTSGSNGGLNGSSSSPVSSGNRVGDNSSRPGPRGGANQPNNGGTGPFTPSQPTRTMDGTQNSGFNFGQMLSGFSSGLSTIFQLVMTFAMIKQMFGWFGGKKETAAEGAKRVLAGGSVADGGANVGRDARTKTDAKTDAERARAEAGGDGLEGDTNGDGVVDGADEAGDAGVRR